MAVSSHRRSVIWMCFTVSEASSPPCWNRWDVSSLSCFSQCGSSSFVVCRLWSVNRLRSPETHSGCLGFGSRLSDFLISCLWMLSVSWVQTSKLHSFSTQQELDWNFAPRNIPELQLCVTSLVIHALPSSLWINSRHPRFCFYHTSQPEDMLSLNMIKLSEHNRKSL